MFHQLLKANVNINLIRQSWGTLIGFPMDVLQRVILDKDIRPALVAMAEGEACIYKIIICSTRTKTPPPALLHCMACASSAVLGPMDGQSKLGAYQTSCRYCWHCNRMLAQVWGAAADAAA